QEPLDFTGIEWLLQALPAEPADNRLVATKTLADFLRFIPPKEVVGAPILIKHLADRCEKFFDVELFAYSEMRIIAYQSLMSLALLGSSLTTKYTSKAKSL